MNYFNYIDFFCPYCNEKQDRQRFLEFYLRLHPETFETEVICENPKCQEQFMVEVKRTFTFTTLKREFYKPNKSKNEQQKRS